MQISVHNEWFPLEEVVLGIAPELYFPAMHPVDARTRQELGTNVLILDPKTIIVQSRHVSKAYTYNNRTFRNSISTYRSEKAPKSVYTIS